MAPQYLLLGQHAASVDINASPEVVYDLVTDITRTPEMSPECRRTEWLGEPARPEVGARFRGRNSWRGFRWWRQVRIVEAERPRAFSFETVPGRGIYNDTTRWHYEFEPFPNGTRVTEKYAFSGPRWIGLLDRLVGRPKALERNVARSLEALKRARHTFRDRTANSPDIVARVCCRPRPRLTTNKGPGLPPGLLRTTPDQTVW
jgi:uncharacterized protein YndB with AHSA1/START domain